MGVNTSTPDKSHTRKLEIDMSSNGVNQEFGRLAERFA